MVTYKIKKSAFNSSSFERSFSNSCCSSSDNFGFSKPSTKELNYLFKFS